MIEALIALGAVCVFVWLMIPSAKKRGEGAQAQARRDQSGDSAARARRQDNSAEMGFGTGMLGGDIEDAAIANFALNRAREDETSSKERDLGTALGMQDAFGDGDGGADFGGGDFGGGD